MKETVNGRMMKEMIGTQVLHKNVDIDLVLRIGLGRKFQRYEQGLCLLDMRVGGLSYRMNKDRLEGYMERE